MRTVNAGLKSDEQLIGEYLLGENSCMGILYDRYYSKVYHKCLSFSKNTDDAFDMAQDILLKAFSKLESFKGESQFSTWLYTICQNHCITVCKKQKKHVHEEVDSSTCNYAGDENDADEILSRIERENKEIILTDYLMDIPEPDRRMLELKYHDKLSVRDLQKEFNLSASAVKMRLLRARHKLENKFVAASA